MDGDSIVRLIYLVVLLVAIGGWFIASSRKSLGGIIQQLSVWAFIFIGVIAVYGMWKDIRRDTMPKRVAAVEDSRISIPRSNDGHFYLTLEVNGKSIAFLVDTGATDIVIAENDARAVGIQTDSLVYLGVAKTANGEVRTAPVELESLKAGMHVFNRIRAWVSDGESDMSLLGQAFLSRFQRIEILDDMMTLEF